MTSLSFNEDSATRRRPAGGRVSATAAMALVLLGACSGESSQPLERPTVRASTAVLQLQSLPVTRSVAGTVVSSSVAPLSAQIVGNVVRVFVSEGDHVRAGQLLVEIDARDGQAQVARAGAGTAEIEHAIEAATANASLAETTYERYLALHERRAVSAQELDEVRARHTTARAELARLESRRAEVRAANTQARTLLDHSYVRSPIDGVVTRRFVDPGAQAAPGVPLVAVEDGRNFRVEATLPESLSLAKDAELQVEIGGQTLPGRITHVQPGVDPGSRSSLVKIGIDSGSPALRSGAYARVLVPGGERQALLIPAGAVVRRGQLTSTFVVDSAGVARLRLITVGSGGEVLSGLEPGERVVTETTGITDGAKVQ